jgi:hypothetical protein
LALSRNLLAVLALAVSQDPARSEGVAIEHTAVECVVAGRYPAFSACFSPAQSLVRARIYYRLGQRPWQFVALVPEGACFSAVLPRPARNDGALRYYLEAVDSRTHATRSPEHQARVIADSRNCDGGVVAAVSEGLNSAAASRRLGTLPIVVIGAGVASAGVALATGGGEASPGVSVGTSAPSTSAPTTVPPSTNPPVTSEPGPSTTSPGPSTTTTLTGPTTTTAPVTSTTTTTTPASTTTMLCSYAASPPTTLFALLGGTGSCAIAAGSVCNWRAQSNAPWIVIQGGGFGTGSGSVAYEVQGLTLGQREGDITLLEDASVRCHIVQRLLAVRSGGSLQMKSDLDVPGAAGQVVWNGAYVRYHSGGLSASDAPVARGVNRIEGQLVAASGRPGLWRFSLYGSYRSGSLRSIVGNAVSMEPDAIEFRLLGRAGERVVFAFETEP